MPLPTVVIDTAIAAAYREAAALSAYRMTDSEALRGSENQPPYVVYEWDESPQRFLTTSAADGDANKVRNHYRGRPQFRCYGRGKVEAAAVAEAVNLVFSRFAASLGDSAKILQWKYFTDYSGKGDGTDYVWVLIYEVELWVLENK